MTGPGGFLAVFCGCGAVEDALDAGSGKPGQSHDVGDRRTGGVQRAHRLVQPRPGGGVVPQDRASLVHIHAYEYAHKYEPVSSTSTQPVAATVAAPARTEAD